MLQNHLEFFSVSALESNTSPRSPGFFYWKMIFKTQDLGTRCVHCYQLFFISIFPWWRELHILKVSQPSSLSCHGPVTICDSATLSLSGLKDLSPWTCHPSGGNFKFHGKSHESVLFFHSCMKQVCVEHTVCVWPCGMCWAHSVSEVLLRSLWYSVFC